MNIATFVITGSLSVASLNAYAAGALGALEALAGGHEPAVAAASPKPVADQSSLLWINPETAYVKLECHAHQSAERGYPHTTFKDFLVIAKGELAYYAGGIFIRGKTLAPKTVTLQAPQCRDFYYKSHRDRASSNFDYFLAKTPRGWNGLVLNVGDRTTILNCAASSMLTLFDDKAAFEQAAIAAQVFVINDDTCYSNADCGRDSVSAASCVSSELK